MVLLMYVGLLALKLSLPLLVHPARRVTGVVGQRTSCRMCPIVYYLPSLHSAPNVVAEKFNNFGHHAVLYVLSHNIFRLFIYLACPSFGGHSDLRDSGFYYYCTFGVIISIERPFLHWSVWEHDADGPRHVAASYVTNVAVLNRMCLFCSVPMQSTETCCCTCSITFWPFFLHLVQHFKATEREIY